MRKRNEQCKTRHAGVVYARRICLRAIAHHRALLPRPAHIQKPQNQPDRDDDRRARQDVIGNLADGTKAHRPDSVGEIFDRAVDIPRPDIEPHAQGAGDHVYRGADMKEMLEAVVRALSREAPAATLQNDEEFERERRARIVWQLDRLMNLRLGAQQRSYTQVAILNELSLISEALVQRRDASAALKGILAHCLDGAGLSRVVLYLADDQGRPQLLVQYGCDNLLGAAKNLFGQPELFATLLKAEYPVQLPSAAVPEQAGRALLAAMEAE